MNASGKSRAVIDGPFAETKELVGGDWLSKCASLQRSEGDDFGEASTLELREQWERPRKQVEVKGEAAR